MVKITDFTPDHKEAFKVLNEAWITKYFTLEDSDHKMLSNPEHYILSPGGAILIAIHNNIPVGTVALIKREKNQFELAKMAVEPSAQGQSIGYQLGVAAIKKAKTLSATSIFLETNSKLIPAISLYKKLGFTPIDLEDSPYQRCDIQMVLNFTHDH